MQGGLEYKYTVLFENKTGITKEKKQIKKIPKQVI